MKPDPRLRLVPPPAPPHAADDEPPFTEEELAEAAALRESLEQGGDPLALALRAAWRPGALADGDVDAIVARALGDEGAPPTRLEREAAAALRDEIDHGDALSPEATLAVALRAAARPAALAPAKNEALIAQALARSGGGRVIAFGARARRVVPVTMAALAGVAALAAGVSLLIRGAIHDGAAPPSAVAALEAPPLIRSRSTDSLFDPAQKFELGEASSRIDRIAMARAQDLRQNRFAAWRVK